MAGIADDLQKKVLFRYAEQLRGAALSMSNNIAEGSGSGSDRDFQHFLNLARRSVFEDPTVILFFQCRGHIESDVADATLERLRVLSARTLSS